MSKKTVGEFLNPRTCIICDLPTGDTFFRKSELLRLGYLQTRAANTKMSFINKNICRHCLAKLPIIFPFNSWQDEQSNISIKALFQYEDPIIRLISNLKFKHRKSLALCFAHLMYFIWQPFWFAKKEHLLVPMPLGKKRLAERGYNQSAEIAKHLSSLSQIPYLDDLLIRKKETLPQTETKNRSERLANLRDAFQISKDKYNINQILSSDHNQIILLDDITTTGTTLSEAARPLRELGFTVSSVVIATEHNFTDQVNKDGKIIYQRV